MRREDHSVKDAWHGELGWVDGYTYAILAVEWRSEATGDTPAHAVVFDPLRRAWASCTGVPMRSTVAGSEGRFRCPSVDRVDGVEPFHQ